MSGIGQANGTQPSFFTRVKAELTKLFTHAPGWEASAAATLTYVAPMVDLLITMLDPGVAPAVEAVLAKVQSAMAAAAVVIKSAGPTPTLITYLNAISCDMAEIESFVHMSDPNMAGRFKALVSAISQEITAIQLEVSTAK